MRDTRASDGSLSGFGQFASYLLLDALVAGRDRHHENWAVVVRGGDPRRLAPSFDHGNALAFAESAESAAALADNPARLATWLSKGRSHHFQGRPSLVGVAVEALELCQQEERVQLTNRLRSLKLVTLGSLIERVPRPILSDGHRRLAVQIVQANRRRLLDAIATRI